MLGCTSQSSVVPQKSSKDSSMEIINKEIEKQYKEVDSFYTTKCVWPNNPEVRTPEAALYSLEDIMTKFEDCYLRHNGWVESREGNQ